MPAILRPRRGIQRPAHVAHLEEAADGMVKKGSGLPTPFFFLSNQTPLRRPIQLHVSLIPDSLGLWVRIPILTGLLLSGLES